MKTYSARSLVSPKKETVKSFNPHYIVGVLISIIGLGVLAQGFRWQILSADKFISLAKSQYIENQRQPTSRGVIYASDSTVFAVDQPVWGIYASLSSNDLERDKFFKNKDKYISTISAILNVSQEELEEKLTEQFMFFKIKSGVSTEKKSALEKANIFGPGTQGFGLYFEREEQRIYPNGSLAAHLLGFIGKNSDGEDVGQYGIEGFYFGDITGQEGYTYEEKDSQGNVILTAEYEPILPRQGKSFTLTVIPSIQQKVEKALKQGVEKNQAKSGSAVILNPNTGAIIAMANYPTYNPNEYWKVTDPWIFKNKAISDVYEYGSVQKPITIAIGLESGKVEDDYTCNDKTGSYKLYDKTIYTWDKQPDGKLTLGGILEKSNNPCVLQVALQTGHDYYYPKLKEFGIGSIIGVGLQDESTGYLMPYEMWTKLDLAVTAFGQSISATPLQITSAISTIANEGKRMRPYIISEVQESEDTIKYKPQVIAQPISEKTAKKVAKMMEGVVRQGESKFFFNRDLPNYSIAGKTGTAQIPKRNEAGYYDDRTNTTFVGFSPVENAQMVMIVRLEEPKLNTFSASTAVPVWIDIFKAVADDLEIPKK
ncbi:MAG: Peptidoglycan glycosyltransferase [candidate division WS6 bacterium GW2011_GWF2_39_15]|uniref:Peptidoglycan glycosyltransferase n=1 Tax=candidate division WS6 bacterium GW2011_GWF2_39_15 TaxID=1619100 RepID=A0A0G0QX09_9BACT|nr:MAG: Peptidoglycan glycosyltransferase [candidate division WS6 bacterium GW2011_GWF2_39_15]